MDIFVKGDNQQWITQKDKEAAAIDRLEATDLIVPGSEAPNPIFMDIAARPPYIPVRIIGGCKRIFIDEWTIKNQGDPIIIRGDIKVSSPEWRDHTFILSVWDVLPEDWMWKQNNPRVPTLICFQEDKVCQCPYKCISKLGMRLHILFSLYQQLEQVLILFERDEQDLIRNFSMSQPYTYEEMTTLDVRQPKQKVPRHWVLVVQRNFHEQRVPWKLLRGNYDSIQQFLRQARYYNLFVDNMFWKVGL